MSFSTLYLPSDPQNHVLYRNHQLRPQGKYRPPSILEIIKTVRMAICIYYIGNFSEPEKKQR